MRVRHRDTAVALRGALDRLGIVVEQRESLPTLLQTHLALIERLAERKGDETTAASAKRMLAAWDELTLAQEGTRSGGATDEGPFGQLTVGSLEIEQDLLPEGARVGVGTIPAADRRSAAPGRGARGLSDRH